MSLGLLGPCLVVGFHGFEAQGVFFGDFFCVVNLKLRTLFCLCNCFVILHLLFFINVTLVFNAFIFYTLFKWNRDNLPKKQSVTETIKMINKVIFKLFPFCVSNFLENKFPLSDGN